MAAPPLPPFIVLFFLFFSHPLSPSWHLFFPLSHRFQYTQIMADVNERTAGERRRRRRRITFRLFPRAASRKQRAFCREVDRRRLVGLNEGWEPGRRRRRGGAPSVACEGDYCAPPPLPRARLLHDTQRLRLTRTYQVISGQADLSLSSLFPGPFF